MSIVDPARPFVVNWTRQNNDRLTRFCSAAIEGFATKEEALEAAGRPFNSYVIDCIVRHFNVTENTATLLATRKRGKKLVLKRK